MWISTQVDEISYWHGDRGKNILEAGMVDPDTDPVQPKTTWAYHLHLDPALLEKTGLTAGVRGWPDRVDRRDLWARSRDAQRRRLRPLQRARPREPVRLVTSTPTERIANGESAARELPTLERKPMTTRDWLTKLDEFLKISGREVLDHAGAISAEAAKTKAELEYARYHALVEAQPRALAAEFEKVAKQLKKPAAPRGKNT